jgi:hypothetical protein
MSKRRLIFIAALVAANAAMPFAQTASAPPPSFELLTHRMDVDVDGAPNAYGPPGKPALDYLSNAYGLGAEKHQIVGFLTEKDGKTPILQGPNDPFPGYYISQTAYTDAANDNERDPHSYVDATKINYVVRGKVAEQRGVQVGDFVSVYSVRTHKSAFAIVGDTGNDTGDEGSLHLLNDLGYPFKDGKDDAVEHGEIIIRFYPNSNPKQLFFFTQAALDEAAMKLSLSRDFSASPIAAKTHPKKR